MIFAPKESIEVAIAHVRNVILVSWDFCFSGWWNFICGLIFTPVWGWNHQLEFLSAIFLLILPWDETHYFSGTWYFLKPKKMTGRQQVPWWYRFSPILKGNFSSDNGQTGVFPPAWLKFHHQTRVLPSDYLKYLNVSWWWIFSNIFDIFNRSLGGFMESNLTKSHTFSNGWRKTHQLVASLIFRIRVPTTYNCNTFGWSIPPPRIPVVTCLKVFSKLGIPGT